MRRLFSADSLMTLINWSINFALLRQIGVASQYHENNSKQTLLHGASDMFSNRFSLKQVKPMILLFVLFLNSCNVASSNHRQNQSNSAVVGPITKIEMPSETAAPDVINSTSTAAMFITATPT